MDRVQDKSRCPTEEDDVDELETVPSAFDSVGVVAAV
jgi:hypothetical protein